MGNVTSRIKRLEAQAGEECPCCSGVRGVFVTGMVQHTDPEWEERVSEEGGRCPVCGRPPVKINVVEEEETWGT